MEEPLIGAEVSKQMLSVLPKSLYTEVRVGEGEVGLVYYDNVMREPLSKGLYRFWNYNHVITYRSRWLQSNYKNKRIILFVDARAIMHLYGICVPIHRELNSPASIHTKG